MRVPRSRGDSCAPLAWAKPRASGLIIHAVMRARRVEWAKPRAGGLIIHAVVRARCFAPTVTLMGDSMVSDLIRKLYVYYAWANRRILDTAARVSPDQYFATQPDGQSLHTILTHTLGAQWVWLHRWRRQALPARSEIAAIADLETLRARWETLDAELQQFAATLTDAELDNVISYVNTRGETWSYPLWQMMMQVVNHGTQHRSEAALRLTELGHSPGNLDFLIFLDETK
ncbi:MAG: DinB family protein [Chloroflexi bacterium]|nr:DinB family protein [Chloroflexota bacterium]